MGHLLSSLKRERERGAAFQATGLLAVSVKMEIQPYLPRIIEHLRQALPTKELAHKRLRAFLVEPPVLTCVCMLARAMGPSVTREVRELLEPMLAVGLSPALTAVLYDLSRQIPLLKRDIQDGLLKMLSLVLMHKPFRHPGTPRSLAQQLTAPAQGSAGDATDVGAITLALRTLGTFEFEGHPLTQFVRHCAGHFLASEHKDIRMEAARTCSYLLTPSINMLSSHGHLVSQTAMRVVAEVLAKLLVVGITDPVSQTAMRVVAEVLAKLLVVGITDPDPDIRYCVLASLDDRFDAHLAQAESLQSLFVALSDEVFEIRELAICTVGRLSAINPAYVMPFLRKTLIQVRGLLGYWAGLPGLGYRGLGYRGLGYVSSPSAPWGDSPPSTQPT
ncbi:serine/threonine-protein kinase mTOR-like [Lampetra fluviatilis]